MNAGKKWNHFLGYCGFALAFLILFLADNPIQYWWEIGVMLVGSVVIQNQ